LLAVKDWLARFRDGFAFLDSTLGDLQEPFRWLADVSVVEAFESEALKLSDFYFTGDDYRYRFEPEARQRFIEILREGFNSGAAYKGCIMKWDTVIQEKTSELGRYLTRRSRRLNFQDPAPVVERTDNRAVRKAILSLTQSEASKRGIGKSELHYMRNNAKGERRFLVHSTTIAKLRKVDSDA